MLPRIEFESLYATKDTDQMKIEHVAIWTRNLEEMKKFYTHYFDLRANKKYLNPSNEFSSYFLSFENGARIELMHRPELSESGSTSNLKYGLAHFAISLGSKVNVDKLTNVLRQDGYEVIGEPRTTGDGYYESVIKDPEGNFIELTV